MKKSSYRGELKKLQVELVRWQEWIKQTGWKVVVVFEGSEAAGKGGGRPIDAETVGLRSKSKAADWR